MEQALFQRMFKRGIMHQKKSGERALLAIKPHSPEHLNISAQFKRWNVRESESVRGGGGLRQRGRGARRQYCQCNCLVGSTPAELLRHVNSSSRASKTGNEIFLHGRRHHFSLRAWINALRLGKGLENVYFNHYRLAVRCYWRRHAIA